MAEHKFCKLAVVGSSPTVSFIFRPYNVNGQHATLVRLTYRFKSDFGLYKMAYKDLILPPHTYTPVAKEEIVAVVEKLILKFPKEAGYYNQGKTVIGFFMGQTIKIFKGTVNPELVKEVVVEKLASVVYAP